MRYISTRGEAEELSFGHAALTGLATDGGLYVPDICPPLAPEDIANMTHQSYQEVAHQVMLPFMSGDVPSDQLTQVLSRAYQRFDALQVAPLRQLGDQFYMLELFHGPTLSFKDIAMQFLAETFSLFLKKSGERVTVIGATSGDTGSAAIAAFAGQANMDIVILHPHGRISEVQRRQMTTAATDNVYNIAIEGGFDECQNLVKAMFNDIGFRNDMRLTAVNSINWARILAQTVYYVYAAAHLREDIDGPVSFCVPTGNFGNIYAGYVAKSMGAPIGKLIAATNQNDILHRFFATGRMKQEQVIPTLSPSMDIQVASNFERLLFDVFDRRGEAVRETMRHFSGGQSYSLEEQVMRSVHGHFDSGTKTDAETLEIMRRVYQEEKRMIDPHTAVGYGVAEDWRRAHPDAPLVLISTAHPAKFPKAVEKATGTKPDMPARIAALFSKEERFDVLPADLAVVQDYMRGKVSS